MWAENFTSTSLTNGYASRNPDKRGKHINKQDFAALPRLFSSTLPPSSILDSGIPLARSDPDLNIDIKAVFYGHVRI